MESGTKEQQEAPDGVEAVRQARKSDRLSPEAVNAAVEWFLTDEEPMTKTIEINVGTDDEKRWVPWTIQPVDMDVLRRISANVSQTGRRGRGGADENQANLSIVVAGTVAPDLKEMAQKRQVAAPEEVLRLRFAQKPGLLGQIAQEILSLSGYDDADLRDPATVGNS